MSATHKSNTIDLKTESTADVDREPRLPRRDLVILPLLSLLTILACLLVSEAVNRHFFAQQGVDACRIDDAKIGYRYRPHCTSRMKVAEGPWVTNAYNDCGYRTQASCAPAPPEVTRIALLGASVSEGLNVPYDETFAARTGHDLSVLLGHPVEVQNMGRINASPVSVYHQIDEALAMKPKLIIMVVDPYDIEHTDPSQLTDRGKPIPPTHGTAEGPRALSSSPLKRIENLVKESATAVAAAHLIFQNSATYVRVFLHYGDHADYLRAPLTPLWETRIQAFEVLVSEMAAKASLQGVPFVLVDVPSLAQVSVSRMRPIPTGLAPDELDAALRAVAERHNIEFVDALDAFRTGPEPSRLFYVVDTHFNGAGQGVVSQVIEAALLRDQRAALNATTPPQVMKAALR